MLIKALQTFFSKIVIAAATFALVVLTSRWLGPEGRGEISLLTLAMALIMLANDFLSGSSLVYFTPRRSLWGLLLPSYLWAFLLCVLAIPILYLSGGIPRPYILPLCLASLFICLLSAHYSVMLGKKMINERNMIQVFLPLLQLLLFWLLFLPGSGVEKYVLMLNTSIGLCLIFSVFILFPFLSEGGKAERFYYPEHLKFGMLSQAGNLVIFLAYRFNYKVVDHYQGKEELGVYSTAIMLGEALLMITQSIATVQHAQIVNSESEAYRQQLMTRNFRLASVVLSAAALLLALLPASFYLMLFGGGFAEVRRILLLFLPDILFLGLASVVSHYYAGVARFKTMLRANILCLFIIVCSGLILVPPFGAKGAAISQSLGYLAVLLYYLIGFSNEKKVSLAVFLPNRALLKEIQNLLKGKKEQPSN